MSRRRRKKKAAIRKHIRKRRNKLWNEDPHCRYCGQKIEKHEATYDHVIPLSRGGKNHHHNASMACKDCNVKKGNKILFDPIVEAMGFTFS